MEGLPCLWDKLEYTAICWQSSVSEEQDEEAVNQQFNPHTAEVPMSCTVKI